MAKKLNISAYFVSQYSWILYFLICFLYALVNPIKTNLIEIQSSKGDFDKDINPFIFAHLTDIHVNRLSSKSLYIFNETVATLKSFSPDLIVLTGDLVDNFDSNTIPRYTDQFEEDWKLYKQGFSSFAGIPLIEIGGNHDLFAVKDITSPHNLILDYSRSYTRENTKKWKDFLIRSFPLSHLNTTIIALNPFFFPTAHTPLLYFSHLSTEILDALENELDKCTSKCIVACHYPTSATRSQHSSKGFTFDEIIGSHRSVIGFLSGHTHPKSVQIYHHGIGNIEIVGPSSRYSKKFGIGVIDGDSLSWSTIDISNPPRGIISYPVPIEQLSSHTKFNDIQNSEIRVVMFSNQNDLNISFSISNNQKIIFNGKLKFSRIISRNHSLYAFPFSQCCIMSNNEYVIAFSGDFDGLRKFIFHETLVVGSEVYPLEMSIFNMLNSTFYIFALLLIIITFPISKLFTYDQIENGIETSTSGPNFYFIMFFGVFLVRTRFQRLNKFLRIFIFLTVILAFGPLMLFKSEDLTGIVTFRGYYINECQYEADHGLYYAYFYLAIVCMPMILLCSSYSVLNWSPALIVDIIFAVIFIFVDIFVFLPVVHETISPYYVLSCLSFVTIPFIYFIIILIWSFRFKSFCKIQQKKDY